MSKILADEISSVIKERHYKDIYIEPFLILKEDPKPYGWYKKFDKKKRWQR